MPSVWQALLPHAEQEMRVTAADSDGSLLSCRHILQHMSSEAACGYPAAKIRSYEWSKKALKSLVFLDMLVRSHNLTCNKHCCSPSAAELQAQDA